MAHRYASYAYVDGCRRVPHALEYDPYDDDPAEAGVMERARKSGSYVYSARPAVYHRPTFVSKLLGRRS